MTEYEPEGLLRGTQLARRVSVSVAYRIAGRIASMAASAASVLLLTRYLSVRDYGYYITATTIATFLSVLVDGGISAVAIRDAAKEPSRREGLAASAAGARLVMAVFATVVGVIFTTAAYGGSQREAVLIGVAMVSASLPITALNAGFQVIGESAVRVGRLVVADTAARFVAVGILALAVSARLGYSAVYLQYVAGPLASLAVLAWAYRRIAPLPVRLGASLRPMLRSSMPLGLALLLNALYFRLDAVLLSLMRQPSDVAIYGLAYRALEIALSLGGFLLAGMLPVMSAATSDWPRWHSIARRTFTFFLLTGATVAVCGWILADRVATLLGGHAYAAAGRTLAVLLLAAGLSWVNGFGGTLIISLDRQRQALWLNVTALGLNVVANLLLIPRFGYLGAAWVTVASEIVNFAGMIWLLRRYANYQWRPDGAGRIGGIVIVVGGGCWALHHIGAPFVMQILVPAAAWMAAAAGAGLLPTDLFRPSRKAPRPSAT